LYLKLVYLCRKYCREKILSVLRNQQLEAFKSEIVVPVLKLNNKAAAPHVAGAAAEVPPKLLYPREAVVTPVGATNSGFRKSGFRHGPLKL
jgi:hypothetical protein